MAKKRKIMKKLSWFCCSRPCFLNQRQLYCDHCPGEAVLVSDHPLGEKPFPDSLISCSLSLLIQEPGPNSEEASRSQGQPKQKERVPPAMDRNTSQRIIGIWEGVLPNWQKKKQNSRIKILPKLKIVGTPKNTKGRYHIHIYPCSSLFKGHSWRLDSGVDGPLVWTGTTIFIFCVCPYSLSKLSVTQVYC